MRYLQLAIIIVGVFMLSFFVSHSVYAEGTYHNLGTPTASDSGSDAISWSNAFPVIIDAYGKYIVPVENSSGQYHLAVSENKGSSWTEFSLTSLGFRPTVVYDPTNDKLHILVNNSDNVIYKRARILRNPDYSINGFEDEGSSLVLDALDGCTSADFGAYPVLSFKQSGSHGIVVAGWTMKKVCSGTTIYEIRSSMRTLSDDSSDFTAGNWASLTGSPSTSISSPRVAYNAIYSYTGVPAQNMPFAQSMFIRGGSGAKSNDIYYFSEDENNTFGVTRLGWNSLASNWSGSGTARTLFGGVIDNSNGYVLKQELITHPIYAPTQDKVYIGIARWLDNTHGDTQSIYQVNTDDSVTLSGNVYSAGIPTYFGPLIDITYNSVDQKLYVFYTTSTHDPADFSHVDASFKGHVYYKTFDGSTFSAPQAFYTQVSGYTADIPVFYERDYDNRLISVFRVDKIDQFATIPHDINFGYISAGGTDPLHAVSLSGNTYSQTTYGDFRSLCDSKTNTQYFNNNNGEIGLSPAFREDFENPISPYQRLFTNFTGHSWGAGSFDPFPTGTITIFNSQGGYLESQNSYSLKTLEFRANFSDNLRQIAGFADSSSFSTYRVFGTGNGGPAGHLYARSDAGDLDLGTGYLGSYHTYKIELLAGSTKYYIDNNLVATIAQTNANLIIIFSNTNTTAGQNLVVDWVQVDGYQTTGSYTSCILDSQINGSNWGTITFNKSEPLNTTLSLKTRTSSDGVSWSSYSSALSSGSTIPGSGRYLQYKLDLTGDALSTPTLNSVSIEFSSPPTPTPSPTATPTSTPTPQPTPTTVLQQPSATPQQSNTSSQSSSSVNTTEPQSTTSHVFVTSIGDATNLFLSSLNSTSPVEQIAVHTLTPEIQGIANAGTRVRFSLQPGSIEGVTTVDANSHFSWSPKSHLEYGEYTVHVFVEDNGKVRGIPTFSISLSPKLDLGFKEIIPESTQKIAQTSTPVQQPEQSTSEKTPTLKAGKTVSVLVTNAKGAPLPNTNVTLHSTPKNATTNSSGVATFTDVEPGEHTIVINTNGSTGSQKIVVDNNPSISKVEVTVKVSNNTNPTALILSITLGIAILGALILIFKLKQANRDLALQRFHVSKRA